MTVTVEVVVTVTLNDADALLPVLSVAEQVTAVVPNGKVEPEAGVQIIGIEPSTRSEAEAEKVTTAPALEACTVISDGMFNFGGVVSTTVTWKEAEPVLPALSVAVHVTLVEASGKVEPEDGVQIGVMEPSTRSEAVAA
jgi:hypothetical protein